MRVHVADLVAEHRRQLVVVAQRREQAAVHVDVAAGHREGVDARIAHDRELVVEVRVVERRGDALADAVDVGDDLGIVDQRRPLADGEIEVLPELALALRTEIAGARSTPATASADERADDRASGASGDVLEQLGELAQLAGADRLLLGRGRGEDVQRQLQVGLEDVHAGLGGRLFPGAAARRWRGSRRR